MLNKLLVYILAGLLIVAIHAPAIKDRAAKVESFTA